MEAPVIDLEQAKKALEADKKERGQRALEKINAVLKEENVEIKQFADLNGVLLPVEEILKFSLVLQVVAK